MDDLYENARREYAQAAKRPGTTLEALDSVNCKVGIHYQPVSQEHFDTVCSALRLPPPPILSYVFVPPENDTGGGGCGDDDDEADNDGGDDEEEVGDEAAPGPAACNGDSAPPGTDAEAAPPAEASAPLAPPLAEDPTPPARRVEIPAPPPPPPVEVSALEVYNTANTTSGFGMDVVRHIVTSVYIVDVAVVIDKELVRAGCLAFMFCLLHAREHARSILEAHTSTRTCQPDVPIRYPMPSL